MSGKSQKSWSDDPYAPQITPRIYFDEKMFVAGFLLGTIFYGIVVVLFFRCLSTLLNPIDRTRGGIKWGFVAHVVLMFSLVTIYTAANLDLQSISYIDNREYPGLNDGFPGPFNYEYLIYYKPISVISPVMFIMNYWLADGLLLYRCFIIYAMNYWVIAFPCLMYLASLAMGIGFIYQGSQPVNIVTKYAAIAHFGTAYYSISLSLDFLLTLMIVGRIVRHSREIQNAMGVLAKPSRLYATIVTILVESCALYSVSYLLFLGPWASSSPVSNAFFSMLAQNQVIAPFLVILRVANRTALTSDTITSGAISSFSFGSQGKSTDYSGTLLDEYSESPIEMSGEISRGLGVGAAAAVEEQKRQDLESLEA